jgi:hypothetical protein
MPQQEPWQGQRWGWRQEVRQSKASLSYMVRICLKKLRKESMCKVWVLHPALHTHTNVYIIYI